MSKLRFKLNLGSTMLDQLDLPVEIRKSNLTLVARTLSSRPVDLDPGIYHVIAILPAGQELYNQVSLKQDDDTIVLLTLKPEDDHLQGWQAQSGNSDLVKASIRVFDGNVLQNKYKSIDLWELPAPYTEDMTQLRLDSIDSRQHLAQFNVTGYDVLRLVQLLQPHMPPINMALPAAKMTTSRLVLTRLSRGLCSMDIHLEHPEADALLRYLQRGLLDQSIILTTSSALSAEEFLGDKRKDPIAAAVGAYALLRLGEIERLHDWTENLRRWFTWLPDGVAIRGEHLARIGAHDEAFTVFLDLPSRGLPIFSDGLSYVIDRLSLYIHIGTSHFTHAKLSRARILLEQLQQFAAHIDFHKPLLTFTGIDPGRPNDKLLNQDIVAFGGLDVSRYINADREAVMLTLASNWERVIVLKELGQVLAQERQLERAQEVLVRAEAIARTLTYDSNREDALRKLSQAFVQAGQWERVEAIVRTLKDNRYRAEVLVELGQALAQAGQMEQALLMWTEAEAIARTLGDEGARAVLLKELVRTITQAGQWERALAIADTLENSMTRARILVELSHDLIQAQQWDRAQAVRTEIEAIAFSA